MQGKYHGKLTDYQRRLLMVARVYITNADGARCLGIRKKTFENRIRVIRKKLDAESVPKHELLCLAREKGFC